MKKATLTLIMFLLIILLAPARVYSELPGKERHALRTLYNNTGGENWKRKKNWKKAPGTEHTWYGITCNADKTTVLQVELPNNNLKGKLPKDMEALENLTILDLSNNQLTGKIPLWIEKLKYLKKLDLSHNRFEGRIPSWLGNLKNLEELVLDDNMLEGPIPGELGSLSKLKVLSLASNRLTGEIPVELGKLRHLLDNQSGFEWNGLYTQKDGLKRFLQQKQRGEDWESTQTAAPGHQGIKVDDSTGNTITIIWNAIKYTADNGGYRVYYREEGQPYDDRFIETTQDKTVTRVTLKELKKRTKYYFKIRTWTEKHDKNRNRIESNFSKEFPAATRGIIISGTVRNKDGELLRGVQVKASNNVKSDETDQSGIYRLNVMSGWTGTVTPFKEGFDFYPPVRQYTDVDADIISHHYSASANTAISGNVTYKGEGITGVELTFKSKEGEAFFEETDNNGSYERIVPYNWSGTVTPEKAGFRFKPGQRECEPVTSRLQGQNFIVNFPGITGRVTNRSGKSGIPGVKMIFSNVETEQFTYLKEYTVTDSMGNYKNDIPTNWSGSVTPEAPPGSKYILYPKAREILTIEDAKKVNFKVEKDFKFFLSITANYMFSAEERFRNVYESGVFYPELNAGFKFSRNLFAWGSFGFFSKSGASIALAEPSRWRQQNLSLGFGYYKNISLRWGWEVRVGAVGIIYREEAFGEKISDRAFGGRLDIAGVFKITDQLFTAISLGYLYAPDTTEETSLILGGLRVRISLGVRY